MVVVVEAGAAVAGDPVPRAAGQVVAGVALDGLEGAQDEVGVEGDEVRRDEQRRDDGAQAQEDNLCWVRVLRGRAEGGAVRVVDYVHVSVEPGSVQGAVAEVEEQVLQDEEEDQVRGEERRGGEGGDGGRRAG